MNILNKLLFRNNKLNLSTQMEKVKCNIIKTPPSYIGD